MKFQKIHSVLPYAAALGSALVPWMIYRKRRPYYVQHLIFSLHVITAYFLFQSLYSTLVGIDIWRRGGFGILLSTVYIAFAIRRLYRDSWVTTAFKAILIRGGMALAEVLTIAIAILGSLFWAAASAH